MPIPPFNITRAGALAGHPDLHHRLRAATGGSVSKSSKTVCVSEDVYGGINACLRGGRIVYREYLLVGKGKDLDFSAVTAFQVRR